MLFFPVNTLNGITDSVFTAYRETQWVFASNVIQSLVKLIFVFLLAGLGVWGVLGSNMLGIFVAVIFCLFVMKIVYRINFKVAVHKTIINEVRNYAFGNYLSGLIGAVPALLMPIIITNRISPAQTAFFYMPNMISGLLTIVPATVSRSYFTESSNANVLVSMKKPILMTYAVLVPLSLLFFFFGKAFLTLFGHDYAAEGYTYLVLITVSVLFSVFNYFLGTRLLIQHKLKMLLLVNILSAFFYLTLSWIFTSRGINGIGISAVISQIISLFVLLLIAK
jgi:O-antigen/teichoic acid export membrane protein